MSETFEKQWASLEKLRYEIENEGYLNVLEINRGKGWGGAGVIFSSKKLKTKKGSFYPHPKAVITTYADNVGWLLNRLKITFKYIINHASKYEFYGRLANAALRYQRGLNKRGEEVKELLHVILKEAVLILNEIENGQFKYDAIGIDGKILDDLKD